MGRTTPSTLDGAMIVVTRLHGSVLALNCDLIERVEATPRTILTMVDGSRYVVRESVAESWGGRGGERAPPHIERGTALRSPPTEGSQVDSQYKNIGLPSTWRTSGR